MATLKVTYSATAALTIVTTALAAAGIVYSSEISNTATRYQDFQISIHVESTLAAASTVWCAVKILPANDSTNYATWNSGISIGFIDFSSATAQTAPFILSNYFLVPPSNFKIGLQNNSGAVLSASGHWANYIGVNLEST